MKRNILLLLFVGFLGGYPAQLNAQNTPVNSKTTLAEEEEEGPIMYKFEPEFLASVEQRKAKIRKMRSILDTLNIKEGKRRRLLKDLYKNGISERLSKALLAETEFEDVDDLID